MPAPRYSSRDMISRLVGFDTTSRESNLDLINFVENYLSDFGVAHERFPSDDGMKSNLFATIGPTDMSGGIVLSGHTDVVPVDGQPWDTDPFTLVEKDGKLFGRGTCDMKSFTAVALALMPEFTARPLSRPVHLALSYDEEVGCTGVRPMIDRVVAEKPRPAMVIVGEPTSMKVVNAHKSIYAFETEVTGLEAHSSATDKGVNAVMIAARLIDYLAHLGEEARATGDPTGRFDPPYSTVHVGVVRGGTALNIIPRRCSFVWEIRGLPGANVDALVQNFHSYAKEEILPGMNAISSETAISTTAHGAVPPLLPEDGSPAETLVMRLAEQNVTEAVSYGTEAGLFQAADLPTVVCGPGSILQAHKPNEFIELDQVEQCEAFMRRLIDHVAE